MLKFGLILLIPTSILASDYGRSHQNLPSNMPMDYNDNNNKDLGVKPGYNFIFNFEQLRRNQPPQIEMRDESMENYMHRRLKTPTTSASIVVPEIKELPENNYPLSRFSDAHPRVNNDNDYQYNQSHFQSTPLQFNPNLIQSTPMPSPPTAPNFSDFSETFNKQAFPHYKSQKPFEQIITAVPEINRFQEPLYETSVPVEKSFEEKIPHAEKLTQELNNFLPRLQQPTVPEETKNFGNHVFERNPAHPAEPHTSRASEYKSHDYVTMRKDTESRHQLTQGHQQPKQIANRGSYKFNQNDLNPEPRWNHLPRQDTSTALPVSQGKNPHPIPTLTPWLDGF